jgi:hypothetical protein
MIQVIAAAMSDRRGIARLSVNGGLSSIMPHRWGNAAVVEVTTVPFDDLLGGSADLVKIDAEGAELLILHGMRKSMLHVRPHILIELTRESLRQATTLARECGYVLRALPNLSARDEGSDLQTESANFLIDPCRGNRCRKLANAALTS